QYVLTKSPDDPRALTYQGLVRMAMGQSTEAAGMLERATKIDPKMLDAWVALAWIRGQAGDEESAEKGIQGALKTQPEENDRSAGGGEASQRYVAPDHCRSERSRFDDGSAAANVDARRSAPGLRRQRYDQRSERPAGRAGWSRRRSHNHTSVEMM